MKFGGTSVQDAPSIKSALELASKEKKNGVLIVSSAMAGVTNKLEELAYSIGENKGEQCQITLAELESRHFSVLEALLGRSALPEEKQKLEKIFFGLKALIKGGLLLKECSPRVKAAIMSQGELLSTTVISLFAKDHYSLTQFLDARDYIKTEREYTSAPVDWKETTKALSNLSINAQEMIITQGFIASDKDGVTTLLGRGGSDYSAAIFGSILQAEKIEIWTDVDGMMTTDPRIAPGAKSIPALSYSEAAELAFFGAKVVHPATIAPAIEEAIPVYIKNTKNPDHPGTLITDSAPGEGLRAIAGKKNITLITVESSRMLNAYGFLSRIFQIFNLHKTSVDLVATSEVSVSMTIDSLENIDPILEELKQIGDVKVDRNNGILCLVGPKLWKDSRFVSEVFSNLHFTDLKMITLGSSDINLSMVVPEKDLSPAISSLHQFFFERAL